MSLTNPNTPISQQDLQDFYHKILPYMGTGGGATYIEGDGIDITDDTISIDPMPAEDMDEIIDALPSGGQVVLIKDAFNKGDLYSTDERLIGQWVDGKPLYQKSFVISSQSADVGEYNISSFGISNVETMLPIEAVVTNGSVMNGAWFSASNYLTVNYNLSDTILRVYAPTQNTNFPLRVTARYTKTTDSPIAIGSDTEYSTTEKIVGTWVGGEPIWQKTYTVDITSTSTVDYTFAHGIANIDKIVDIKGIYWETSSSPNEFYNIPSIWIDSTGTDIVTFSYISVENTTNIKLRFKSNVFGVGKVFITIQYTKTT